MFPPSSPLSILLSCFQLVPYLEFQRGIPCGISTAANITRHLEFPNSAPWKELIHSMRNEGELSPTPTQTFKLLQLTGQILIGNCNSINWGWWITGSVRKALKQGRLVDGSRILLWSSGGKDNRKQRTGRGLALNPLVFLIQGWLNPKKALGMKVQQHQGDRDQIRDKLQPREHLGNRAWISWLEWENTWLQGNSIV